MYIPIFFSSLVFPSNTGEEDQSSHGGPAATAGSSGKIPLACQLIHTL